jgi:Uma2 family endonuclease
MRSVEADPDRIATGDSPMSVAVQRKLFSVDEYHRMAEAAVFGEDDRVELIAGEVVEMSPIGSRHAACVRRLVDLISRQLPPDVLLDVQNPLRLDDRSEPLPDLMLLRRTGDYYAGSPPTGRDLLLLIEVADTSSEYDHRIKLPLYARSGVAEVWIVDLVAASIAVHRDPSGGRYRDVSHHAGDEGIAPGALPGLVLAVADVLG